MNITHQKKEEPETLKLPEVVERYYDYCVWIIPKISKFQKDQRYILGTAIESKSLEILDLLIEGALRSDQGKKREFLNNANLKLQQLRYYFRLAQSLKLLNIRSCNYGTKLLVEIGSRIGAWQKGLSS